MFLLEFMVTVKGLAEPVASPLQFANVYPALGAAVRVKVEPKA